MAVAPAVLRRSRVSARVISLALRTKSIQSEASTSIPISVSRFPASMRRPSLVSRLLTVSSCLESMLPLHSAIASARLKSVLAAESQHWAWVPQGISMPL